MASPLPRAVAEPTDELGMRRGSGGEAEQVDYSDADQYLAHSRGCLKTPQSSVSAAQSTERDLDLVLQALPGKDAAGEEADRPTRAECTAQFKCNARDASPAHDSHTGAQGGLWGVEHVVSQPRVGVASTEEPTASVNAPAADAPAANEPAANAPAAAPILGVSHIFTCGGDRWTYHAAGPRTPAKEVQMALTGFKSISWCMPPGPALSSLKKKPSKKRHRDVDHSSFRWGEFWSRNGERRKKKALTCVTADDSSMPMVMASPRPKDGACLGLPYGVATQLNPGEASGERWYRVASAYGPVRSWPVDAKAEEELAGVSVEPCSTSVPREDCRSGDGGGTEYGKAEKLVLDRVRNAIILAPPAAARVPRVAPVVNDPHVSMVCMCQFPNCNKIFAHADGCRKHARKWHNEWLRDLDKMSLRCFRWERAWREGLNHAFQVNRHGAPLPLDVLVSPPKVDKAAVEPLVSRQRKGRPPKRKRTRQRDLNRERGAGDRDSDAAVTNGSSREQRPRLTEDLAAKGVSSGQAIRAQSASERGLLSSKMRAATSASSVNTNDKTTAGPALRRASIADAAAAARPGANRGGKAHKLGANAARSANTASSGEQEATEASIVWCKERGAHNAVLPHGATWSMRQIEWFVGMWWKHLANASVSTFETSLSQFSSWASDEHGLESFISWLPKTLKCGEDLVTLQILELLEYAELVPLPRLKRLSELVLQLQAHKDTQIAETAERVFQVFEEVAVPGSPPEAADVPSSSVLERARQPSVVLQTYDSAQHARSGGGSRGRGKERSTGARDDASHVASPKEQRRGRPPKTVATHVNGHGPLSDENDLEAGRESAGSGEDADLGCVCGTDRHLPSNAFSFAGVWVQCERCHRWCHGECTGMTLEEAVAAEHFFCARCAHGRPDNEKEGFSRPQKKPRGRTSKGKMSRASRSGRHPDGSGERFRLHKMGKPRPAATSKIREIDNKLWNGACEQGWRFTCKDDSGSSQSFSFEAPTGEVFQTRAEAVLHAATQLERTMGGQ